MNTLALHNISKVYTGGLKALDHVSLTLQNGMFGLLGPNGAGKSSLMRTIATLQATDSGTITFNRKNIQTDPNAIRTQLGYLPQEFGVYPGISAERLLDYMAILKGVENKAERRDQVQALLQLTNLYSVRHKAVSVFSGGMRQRFGIAQALLGDPKILIVDEPTAGLDPEERNRLHHLLSELSDNMIVLLSTHIVDDVQELCTAMAIIISGKIRVQGAPSALVDSLKGQVWRKMIKRAEVNIYKEQFTVISEKLQAGTIQLHVLADTYPGAGFELVEPTLEDLYFAVLAGSITSETACYV